MSLLSVSMFDGGLACILIGFLAVVDVLIRDGSELSFSGENWTDKLERDRVTSLVSIEVLWLLFCLCLGKGCVPSESGLNRFREDVAERGVKSSVASERVSLFGVCSLDFFANFFGTVKKFLRDYKIFFVRWIEIIYKMDLMKLKMIGDTWFFCFVIG